jgi:hypothetical protein
MYDYDCIQPVLVYSHSWDKYKAELQADYVVNMAEGPANDRGYYIGGVFGCKKLNYPLAWNLQLNYKHYDKDAFPDCFGEVSGYDGKTDVKGTKFTGRLALMKNMILALSWYDLINITGAHNRQNIFQTDLQVKF